MCRALLLSALLLTLAGAACAQPLGMPGQQREKDLDGVGLEQRLGGRLPLGLKFTDDKGRTIELGALFDGKRPVLLTFNYFRCPSLCSMQLNALLEAMKGLEWRLGGKFQVVTISFDTRDTTEWAAAKKERYVAAYGHRESAKGWHFLTGEDASIRALARTVGFRYRWIAGRQEFAHPAFLAVCTPDGRMARYLAGTGSDGKTIQYAPSTLRLALVESGEGKISSPVDQVILFCLLRYDSQTGKYSLAVIRLVQLAGGVTLLVVFGWLVMMRRRGGRECTTSSS